MAIQDVSENTTTFGSQFTLSPTETSLVSLRERPTRVPKVNRYVGFGLVSIPTIVSFLLLAGYYSRWELPRAADEYVAQNRVNVQIIVQVLSNTLAFSQTLVLCRLFNYATRIRIGSSPIKLNTLRLWTAISTLSMRWNIPYWMLLVCVVAVHCSAVLSALWAGALTPVVFQKSYSGSIEVPDWTNTSFIMEYPAEINQTGPSIRNGKGFFTYSVGLGLMSALVTSASSATTVDGSRRRHIKLDNTDFTYIGRSYGAGATVGLLDDSILKNNRVLNYAFQEVAYDISVSCIYNQSSDFRMYNGNGSYLYALDGELPDSGGKPEDSNYLGHDDTAIVAAGVTYVNESSDTRYMALAAGSSYHNLDLAQCAATFTPTLFNVSVNAQRKTIEVAKMTAGTVDDIDPSRHMSHVIMRQIELISNDLTSFHRSSLGDAFNASISNYASSVANMMQKPTSEQVALIGLGNSVISLLDDLFVGYSSAQAVVGKMTKKTTSTIQRSACHFGSEIPILAVGIVNCIILLIIVIEFSRTQGWKTLTPYDYADERDLLISVSLGGTKLAAAAVAAEEDSDQNAIGKIPIALKTTSEVHGFYDSRDGRYVLTVADFA